MQVNVKVNTAGLDRIARDLPKAAKSGLKKAAEQGKTRASDLIRSHYNISKSNLEKPAPGKSKGSVFQILSLSGNKLGAILRISGNKIPLIRFGAKWKRTMLGARVSILDGKSTTYAHTFVQTMKSGHEGVFIRKSLIKAGSALLPKKTRTAKLAANRQIIEEAGPAPGQMIKKGDMLDRLKAYIAEKAPDLIMHEFDWRSKK